VISEGQKPKLPPIETPASNAVKGWAAMALWRIDACKAESGDRSNTSIYNRIRDGLWTKPVAIGQRAKAWPDYEVKAIVRARIAGQSDEEIRELVNRLHAKRVDQLATV
jgi:prophage regulatory protein